MVASKVLLVALMIACTVCLGYALDEPTIAVDDAGDRVAQAANTALSKSRFPAGRSLLQDTTVGYNDMKDLVLAKTNEVESKSKRVFASRTLLGEGKSDFDRMQSNLEKISQGTSKVADAAQRITMSVGRRNWVTRRMLGEGKSDFDRMTLTANKVDEAMSGVENAFDDIKIKTDMTMQHQGRQLRAKEHRVKLTDTADASSLVAQKALDIDFDTKHAMGGRQLLKVEIPDTDTVSHKINQAVSDMGFDAERKFGSRASSRQLLKAEIPDTDTVSHKINQAVSDMNFDAERKYGSRASSRQLLKVEIPDTDTVSHKINQAVSDMGFDSERKFASRASSRQLLQSAVPAPKIVRDSVTVKSIDRNKAKIDSGSNSVDNMFAKIASRAGFRI